MIVSEEDFEHLTVNHSLNFVDPQTGAYTQNIECLWWQIKCQLPDTFSKHHLLYLHLSEYMWHHMKPKHCDLFYEFLVSIGKYYKGP